MLRHIICWGHVISTGLPSLKWNTELDIECHFRQFTKERQRVSRPGKRQESCTCNSVGGWSAFQQWCTSSRGWAPCLSAATGVDSRKTHQILTGSTQTCIACCCIRELHRQTSSPFMLPSSLVANSAKMLIFNPRKGHKQSRRKFVTCISKHPGQERPSFFWEGDMADMVFVKGNEARKK